MKIIACLASRGRPAAMIGVVMSLHRQRSTQHEIDFVLGLDEDDPTTEHVGAFDGEIHPIYSVAPSPIVRGEIENRMIGVAGASEPDAVTLMSDRTFNITPGWDNWLAGAVQGLPTRVLWWSCPDDPGCVIPIIPKAYLQANEWTWSPQIFPFWWDDTWHQEIDLMIHGMPSKKARCTYAGARGATANGREFAFWLDVFIKTRPRRREQAARIAGQFGVPLSEDPNVVGYMNAYDNQMVGRCAGFEERFGDKREPSAKYLAARARAEEMLKEIA